MPAIIPKIERSEHFRIIATDDGKGHIKTQTVEAQIMLLILEELKEIRKEIKKTNKLISKMECF